MAPAGLTSISAGIAAGDRVMTRGNSNLFSEKTMIVMTDGLHNTGRSPLIDGRIVADKGVTIHTVTFGDDSDQNMMRQLADIGGGIHLHARDARQLQEAFETLANTLSTFLTD